MEPTQDHFPVFETNQVLTSEHLNTVFTYLDEQNRLTRAHLIGIGIVCGLQLELAGTAAAPVVKISKGCGVTSQGFLVNVPDDLRLTHYRADYKIKNQYEAESDLDPAVAFTVPGSNPAKQYALWELFEAGDEPNAIALGDTSDLSLDGKAVLLFLELKQQGLRNCSPNNCDDKGSEVTATVKPLLIEQADLNKMIAEANGLSPTVTTADLAAALLEKWNLPDLRLPRFDVPNSGPVETADVYGAFLEVFRKGKLAGEMAKALRASYKAFRPLLKGLYPTDPFSGFAAQFGFLDSVPKTAGQVKFLQYYYDLFDDLLRAYEEFRWKGAELACECCPSEALFPRHLMLGLLHPNKVSAPDIYRHGFIASSVGCCCGERLDEARLLFQRLVELTLRFTNAPSLPPIDQKGGIDQQIRITPSVLGHEPLSARAIPYYYTLDGTPRLYELWNPEKTRRHLTRQNLGYHSTEYVPAAPDFVTNPLRYDLEPYGFLRIEGHVGKNYQNVLETLLTMKAKYRLPVEFVALCCGDDSGDLFVDTSTESARFQDLEALYDSQREALLRSLTEGLMALYNIEIDGIELPGAAPKHPLLKKYAPYYKEYPKNSLGAWCEANIKQLGVLSKIDIDLDDIADSLAVATKLLSSGTSKLPDDFKALVVVVYYFSELADALPMSLDALKFDDFDNLYETLLQLVRFFRAKEAAEASKDLQDFIPREDLIDLFDHVLYSCELGPIGALYAEYLRRLRELKQQQLLAYFLRSHPGVQHKAGVPMGGTFVLVYHQDKATEEAAPSKEDEESPPKRDEQETPGRASANWTRGALKDGAFKVDSGYGVGSFLGGRKDKQDEQERTSTSETRGAAKPDTDSDKPMSFRGSDGKRDEQERTLISETRGATKPDTDTDKPMSSRGSDGKRDEQERTPISETRGATKPDTDSDKPMSFRGSDSKRDEEGQASTSGARGAVRANTASGSNSFFRGSDGNQAGRGRASAGGIKGIAREIASKSKKSSGAALLAVAGKGGQVKREQIRAGRFEKFKDEADLAPNKRFNREQMLAGRIKELIGEAGLTPDRRLIDGIASLIKVPTGQGIGADGKTANVIAETVESLLDGTVIADFYLPYRISADCAGVQFVLPNKPPVVSVELGCPNDQGAADVKITVDGGMAPYEMDIDGAGYQVLASPIELTTGTHTLIVRDAEGLCSAPHKVDIVPIFIDEPTYQCGDDYTTYTATVAIRGGKPPYTVNGSAVEEVFVSEPILSGEAYAIKVVDANGCVAQAELTYACEKPCTLPCDGIAVKRGYLFCLPEPALGAAYASVEFTDANFTFEVAQEDSVDLSSVFLEGLRKITLDGWNKDFAKALSTLLEAINAAISDKKADLVLSYKQPKSGEFGVLEIERFECLTFKIDVTVTTRRAEKQEKWRFVYGPDGTDIHVPGQQGVVKIPAFGGATIEKCRPEPLQTPLCDKAPDIQLSIDQQVTLASLSASLSAKLSGAGADGATLFWEVPGATPAIASSPVAVFKFASQGSKPVLLTAFDKNGCAVTETAVLNMQSKEPPVVDVALGCPDASGFAVATVTVNGGTAPYEIEVDAGGYKALVRTVRLAAGAHTLTVRDAKGTLSTPQKVDVVPIAIGTPTYQCGADYTTYTATISIGGGTPPYTVNGGAAEASYTTKPIPSGEKFTLNVMDAKKCSAKIEVAHTCTKPCTFTTAIGCPDANGAAVTTVTVDGGTAPYQIDIDGKGYAPLTGPITLARGSHTLTVRDSKGVNSSPQSVSVSPIVIGKPSYLCGTENTTYTATVSIDGGTPPYTVNGGAAGTSYTTKAIPSGEKLTLNVMDAKKCSAQIEVEYTCAKPCKLPCDGVAERRDYRFWLPTLGTGAVYGSITFESAIFEVDIAPGERINMSDDFLEKLKNVPLRLWNKDFSRAASSLLDAINLAVSSKAGFALDYAPPKQDGFGTLSIERFKCLGFRIEVVTTFQRPEKSETWRFAYDPRGMSITLPGRQDVMKIPASGGVKIEKCQPASPSTPLCEKVPDIQLSISQEPAGRSVKFIAKLGGADAAGVTLLWDAPDATPPMANTAIATFQFTSPGTKNVQLTAFTRNGCTVTKAVTVNIG